MSGAFEILVLGGISVVAYGARGLTGASSGMVFNSAFLIVSGLGLAGNISLHEGQYQLAITEFVGAVLMAILLRSELRLERFTVLTLCGVLPTTALFAALLPRLDVAVLRVPLAAAILLGGLFLVFQGGRQRLSETAALRLAIPIGLFAGVLGGLFGIAGAIVTIFVSLTGASPAVFRARMATISLAMIVVRVAVLAAQGVYTPPTLLVSSLLLPCVAVGIVLGLWAHRRLSATQFKVIIGLLVAFGGIGGLVQGLPAILIGT